MRDTAKAFDALRGVVGEVARLRALQRAGQSADGQNE
jgi:hypothetical protein